jgi:hypothetical protein
LLAMLLNNGTYDCPIPSPTYRYIDGLWVGKDNKNQNQNPMGKLIWWTWLVEDEMKKAVFPWMKDMKYTRVWWLNQIWLLVML